ncbi:MAG: hypothetical protein EBT79_04300 [Actinobacteria bacterium]|nr:hypothetical protein [Actinomycetota bacterium]
MDTILKAFLANLGAHIGGSASDAAVECVRIATNVPSLAGCLPKDASPQTTKVEMASAPTQTITVVTPDPAVVTELADAKATILRLEEEIAALKAAPKPEKVSAPSAPKAAKTTATGITDLGKLKAIVIDGTEIPVRSWRAGTTYLMDMIYTSDKKGNVPTNWWRPGPSAYAVQMPCGDYGDDPGTLVVCEKRIRKSAEVLGVSITLRIAAADGTTQDVSL